MKPARIVAVLAAGLAVFVSCKEDRTSGSAVRPTAAADLRVTGQIPGWTEERGSFKPFTTVEQLARDVGLDGEAYWYDKKGLTEGIYQKLSSGDGIRLQLYILGFETDTQAAGVYTDLLASLVPVKVAVGDLPPSVAVAADNGNSAVVYARLGRFFCKLSLTDYGNTYSKAGAAAVLFLRHWGRTIVTH